MTRPLGEDVGRIVYIIAQHAPFMLRHSARRTPRRVLWWAEGDCITNYSVGGSSVNIPGYWRGQGSHRLHLATCRGQRMPGGGVGNSREGQRLIEFCERAGIANIGARMRGRTPDNRCR